MPRLSRPVLGWVFYDFANSAFATTILAVIFNRHFALEIAGGPEGTLFTLFGANLRVPGSALWSFLVAASTAVVALSSPLLGAMADEALWRKRMLVIYCYTGVAATCLLATTGAGDILTASILFTFANLGFAGGNVFYNAFLVGITDRGSYGRVSGAAWGLGYLGGGLCLLLNLVMLEHPQLLGFPEGYFPVGDCFIVAGLWWGLFALPTMFWVRERPGDGTTRSIAALGAAGWGRLKKTLRQLRHYRQLVRFWVAYLLFNDGIETVIIMAAIFGAEVIGMQTGELVAFFLMIQGTALLGSFLFGWLADKTGNRTTLLITIAVWLGVVLWAYLLGWTGDPRSEFYIIGILAGAVMGGSQATARAMQASFTPDSYSAEFFGFYAVSGRFASIFGPLLYGGAILVTGGVQPGILVVGLFFLAGGVLLLRVDEKEGILAAGQNAESSC